MKIEAKVTSLIPSNNCLLIQTKRLQKMQDEPILTQLKRTCNKMQQKRLVHFIIRLLFARQLAAKRDLSPDTYTSIHIAQLPPGMPYTHPASSLGS